MCRLNIIIYCHLHKPREGVVDVVAIVVLVVLSTDVGIVVVAGVAVVPLVLSVEVLSTVFVVHVVMVVVDVVVVVHDEEGGGLGVVVGQAGVEWHDPAGEKARYRQTFYDKLSFAFTHCTFIDIDDIYIYCGRRFSLILGDSHMGFVVPHFQALWGNHLVG